MVKNQTVYSWLPQSSVIKCLFAEKCKFREECVMRTEKNVLAKNLYKWVKHGFVTTKQSWKDSPLSENTDPPG